MIYGAALLFWGAAATGPTNVQQLVQESAQVTEADRKASYQYDSSETDLESDGSRKTYRVHMLYGSPYRELTAVNGEPLASDQAAEEKRKLEQEKSRRMHESPEEREKRVAEFQKEQTRDQRFIKELVDAFEFTAAGEQQVDGREVYVIDASPRAGFHPIDRDSEVLTGMRGRLWIDKATHQWVKVEAEVIHPVSIEGFLAKVEPGTRFELEKMPVEGDIWLPKHFAMTSKAKVLSVFKHRHHEEETYFDYRKSANP